MDLGILIPIIAVGGSSLWGIIKTITDSQEKRLEMRLQAQQNRNEEVSAQVAALRQEVAALRDTSTQFDMSQDHAVQRLEERLGRLEMKSAAQAAATPHEEPQQRVGLR